MKHLIVALSLIFVTGCSGPERVSPAEFKRHYLDVGVMHSMRHVAFLGVRGGNAYLEVSSMRVVGGGWKKHFLFVPLGELEAELRHEILQKPNKAPEPRP